MSAEMQWQITWTPASQDSPPVAVLTVTTWNLSRAAMKAITDLAEVEVATANDGGTP